MLIAYLEPLQIYQIELLISWRGSVNYWPRSWAHTDSYNAAIPTDWWLLFGRRSQADLWLIKYPEHSRIVRTLFDDDK